VPDDSNTSRSRGTTDVTRLLNLITRGLPEGQEGLTGTIYEELRSLAAHRMAGERVGHTLQATALVNEVYLRLVAAPELEWECRGHFYTAAAEAMRRILVEHARRRGRDKRGGGWRALTLEAVDLAAEETFDGILALDEALQRLEQVDARAAEIVRLRFYAGLDVDQTALAAGVSRRTVLRDWAYAKAWLAEALGDSETNDGESR